MSLKLFVIPLITFYLAFQLQQTNATFLVESATGKALIQSACSACDSPPACYAVLNPIANHPNLNPTDICTVAVQAAQNIAKITFGMLNVSASVAVQIARNPAVQQSIRLCTQEYAQVLDQIEKAAAALTQKVDEDKVPEFLSTAIAAIAKCDASAGKVANSAVQITTKNLDCSKMLKNALGIYKVFAEYIENPSHDPKQITGSVAGNMGGKFDSNAGGGAGGGGDVSGDAAASGGGGGDAAASGDAAAASGDAAGDAVAGDVGGGGGIIGLSAPTSSPTPKGGVSNNMKFSIAQNGEFRKEFSASGKGNVQFQPKNPSTDSSANGGSSHSQVNTNMKFEGLGLGFGKRIKGFLNPDENTDSGSSAGAPESGNTPPQISTNMKFEGLGFGFGERIKELFHHDSQTPDSESSSGALQSGSSAGAPESGNTPPQISTNMKFEGLGLGFGERIKELFHHDSQTPDSESSAGALQSGSSAGAPESGNTPPQINTNMKFEGLGLGFGERIKELFHPDSEIPDSESSAGALQSGSSAGAPESGNTPFGERIKEIFHPDSQIQDSESSADALKSGSSADVPETGSTPPQISTNMKFEGLGLGFGKRIKGFLNPDENADSGSSAGAPQSGNTPSQISTNMKFEGLGLGFGKRIKGFLNPDENTDSGSSAGAPQSGNTPPQISSNMKFEGLGLGFGERIKGLFHPDSGNTDSGSSGSPSPSGSSPVGPQTRSSPSQISTNTKFEGLGLGFGQRIKGFFNPDSQNTDVGSSAGTTLSGSNAGPPVNTGLKFSLSGFAKSFTSSKKNKEQKGSGSPSPAPSNAPSSSGSAKTPSPSPSPSPGPVDSDASSAAPDDGANSYTDDDVTLNDGNDSPTPSPSGNNGKEVSLKYSLSHLIPDT